MRTVHILAVALIATIVAGCGSAAAPPPRLAASVAGQQIPRADLTAYVRYADHYYSVAGGSHTGTGDCPTPHPSPTCATLRRQSLVRLIEERLVVSYTHRHRISLSLADRMRVATQLSRLVNKNRATSRMLRSHAVTREFLHRLLVTEALVRKLESRVAGLRGRQGTSFHLRMYTIPLHASGTPARTFRAAETFATEGKSVPSGALEEERWVAPFRLPSILRRAVTAASDGDFAGPYRRGDAYLVVQRLAMREHTYARPARIEMQTRLFQDWLGRQARRAPPKCYAQSGNRTPCPAIGMMKVA